MKRDTWFISFISLVTVGIAVVIFFDLVPTLRGPGQWHWYTRPLTDTKMLLFSLGPFILFIVIWYLIGVRLPSHPSRRQTWLARGILLILTLSVQVTIMLTYRSNPVDILFERLASDRASGYLTMAQTVEDMPAVLQDYPQWMNRITHTTHVRNRPPGILLVYWGLFQVMDKLTWLAEPISNLSHDIVNPSYWLVKPTTSVLAANTVLAVVTPLISTLIIWPAYGICSRRWGTRTGWIAAGLVALIPGRLAFAPEMDTVYPFLALFALYLADMGLRRNKCSWFFWAGLVMSITTYMSPINFAVVALIGLYIFLIYTKERGNSYVARSLWRDLSIFGVGVLSIWLFFWIFFGVSIIELTLKLDRDTIILGRSYWFWLVGDLVDFFLFGGFAAVLLASSWPFINRYAKLPQAIPALAISFWLILLLLNLSGLIRGETGRIWLMLTPFPALLAAAWIKYVTYKTGVNNNVLMTRLINSGLLILLATAALAYAITMRWQVISLGWPSPM